MRQAPHKAEPRLLAVEPGSDRHSVECQVERSAERSTRPGILRHNPANSKPSHHRAREPRASGHSRHPGSIGADVGGEQQEDRGRRWLASPGHGSLDQVNATTEGEPASIRCHIWLEKSHRESALEHTPSESRRIRAALQQDLRCQKPAGPRSGQECQHLQQIGLDQGGLAELRAAE